MGDYTVPSKQGRLIGLNTSNRDCLSCLEIVWANKFEDESISPEGAIKKEAEFYKGAPPQWLNFYWAEKEGSPFVRRDMYEMIRKEIDECKNKSWSIIHVDLYHQPGSGGSTLAMQILWDLRKELRCAKLTDSTADTKTVAQQVVRLFNAEGPQNQNTVLLLLDNSNDSIFKTNLEDSLIKEMKGSGITATVPLVIILNCVRQLTETKSAVLKTSLSKKEEKAFKEKHAGIIQRHGDKHTQFHAFNIMLNNYSCAYVSKACEILNAVKRNQRPRKEQLLAILVLVNAYAPGSYLPHDLCCHFLEKKDRSFDELSLEEQIQPFTDILVIFSTQEGETRSQDKRVRMAHPMIADTCLQLLTLAGVTRSDTIMKLLTNICGDKMPMHLVKTTLTKREDKDKSDTQDKDTTEKARFSRLIEDIKQKENKPMCISVLKKASERFDQNAFLPQALARFYYIEMNDYEKAERWAKIAIKRDKENSFIIDTLAQVHKNHLKKLIEQRGQLTEILKIGKLAAKAFEDEAEAAIKEQSPEMKEDGVTKTSVIFNYRGYFGYMEVANIIFDYITKFDRTWSKVLKQETDPPASFSSCGKYKTFLNCLRDEVESKYEFFEKFLTYSKPRINKDEQKYIENQEINKCYDNYVTQSGQVNKTELQKLKERHVSTFTGLLRAFDKSFSESELDWITGTLKKDLRSHSWRDADPVLKYILANFLLSQRNASSKELRPLGKLQSILKKHWNERKDKQSPEFYLLVLLLFWPNEGQVEDGSPDISECIEYMHQSFDKSYQSFFRSRYLVPLFFLKGGDGLQKVVRNNAVIPFVQGEVQNYKVFAVIGSQKIEVSPESPASVRQQGQVCFNLGFSIKGPVACKIRYLKY